MFRAPHIKHARARRLLSARPHPRRSQTVKLRLYRWRQSRDHRPVSSHAAGSLRPDEVAAKKSSRASTMQFANVAEGQSS